MIILDPECISQGGTLEKGLNRPMQYSIRHSAIKHVLLVDDNPDNIALTRRALARIEYTVHLEVLQQLAPRIVSIDTSAQAKISPDLILVELNISKLDGYKFIRNIRQQQLTMHTPIVVISMSNSAEEVFRCYDQGASSFIYKAVDFTEYAQVLREVCAYWLNRNISPSYPMRAVK